MVSYSEIAHYFESLGLDDLKTALDGDNIRSLISNLRVHSVSHKLIVICLT